MSFALILAILVVAVLLAAFALIAFEHLQEQEHKMRQSAENFRESQQDEDEKLRAYNRNMAILNGLRPDDAE